MQDPIGSFWCGKASKMALPIRTHALSLAHTHVRKATARSSLKFTSTHANSLAHSHVRKLHTARSSNNSCSHARTFIRLHTRSSQAHCKIFQYQFFPKKHAHAKHQQTGWQRCGTHGARGGDARGATLGFDSIHRVVQPR